jgi:hypothetical protein
LHAVLSKRHERGVARAFPAPLRCDRRDGSRSRTIRRRRADHCPLSSCDSYSKRTEMRLPVQHLHEPAVEFTRPFASEEGFDRLASLEELVAISPPGVLCVGEGHPLWVAGVTGVLGHLHLLPRGLLVERWKWRPRLLAPVRRLRVRPLPVHSHLRDDCPQHISSHNAKRQSARVRPAPFLLRGSRFTR